MHNMRVDLPGELALTCPQCGAQFRMDTPALSGVTVLYCPRCSRPAELYDLLEPQLRRKVYHAVRDALEQRVHEQRQMDEASYFEDTANLPPEA